MTEETHFPVVVIGAGLAGLSAAAHLSARDIPPLLLEADSLWPGGRLSGGDPIELAHQGQTWVFRPDHGVHGLWGGYVNMRAMIERFTETRLQRSTGEEWINRWGLDVRRIEAGTAVRSRWIPAPFHYLQLLLHPQIWGTIQPWDFLSLPGVLASLLLTLSVDPIGEKRSWDELSLADFFIGWTPNLRATFEGLAANLLAAPRSEISLTAMIAALRFYTLLRNDAWTIDYLPADAHTSLIQPLLDHIESGGGRLLQGVTVQRLERDPDGWRVIVSDDNRRGQRVLYAARVILATNAPAAQRILCASPDTHDSAQKMIFPGAVGNATVRLWFSKAPQPGPMGGMFTGDFNVDNFFWLHRFYDDYREFYERTGGSTIELHFYDDRMLDLPERNLIIEAVSEVQRAHPELSGSFLHADVRRNSKVHTRFRVPTDETLHVETPWPGLFAAGDWVGFETPSMWMERATATGIGAANAVLVSQGREAWDVLQPPPPGWLAGGLSVGLRGGRRLIGPPIMVARRAVRHLRGKF